MFRLRRVPFEDGYLEFITGSVQRARVPIHTVHFAGAGERREQMQSRDGRWHHDNVAYLTLYGSGDAVQREVLDEHGPTGRRLDQCRAL